MSKSSETSVFVWVPTGTYIRQNYEQDLIDNLTEGNLFKAFSADKLWTPVLHYMCSISESERKVRAIGMYILYGCN